MSKNKANNYLFVAFSGEELGLYGSKYFADNPTIDLGKVSYMINMDMLGRLNEETKTITVGGYGTSPLWGELYAASAKTNYTIPTLFIALTVVARAKRSYFLLQERHSGTLLFYRLA
jgi:Zn-dependent M28 family amino/carboxypeptidase